MMAGFNAFFPLSGKGPDRGRETGLGCEGVLGRESGWAAGMALAGWRLLSNDGLTNEVGWMGEETCVG